MACIFREKDALRILVVGLPLLEESTLTWFLCYNPLEYILPRTSQKLRPSSKP